MGPWRVPLWEVNGAYRIPLLIEKIRLSHNRFLINLYILAGNPISWKSSRSIEGMTLSNAPAISRK